MDNISIYITNLGKYNEGYLMGEWVKLPVPDDRLSEVLERIGINGEYDEYFITDYEASFANLNISEYACIEELNDFARRLDEVEVWDIDKLCAVLEMEEPTSIADIVDIIENLDDFDLLVGVEDDQALGEYFADELGTLSAVPEHLRAYFDYGAYGRDIKLEAGNYCYTSYGFVMRNC